ncbi:hypothetical protein LAUMK191_05631 [Mycobacterium attenuatum]|uniref:Uncharacterized protein n=1 Tax=Mycobacterium attenuatum TaxID=2341086 RepID=A0A498QG69_9MYCO|nr:hypothetical protein LAUMK136_05621 [Mycobacterium attenuatum]VBA60660.1 hypothetical protein LAUMK191_05631 [Mycobacterium attenuatum]
MFVGGQAAPADLGEQVGEAGIPRQVDAKHQHVDEKSHQLLEPGLASPGDRKPNRHIATGADVGQQHRQRRLDHHEAGDVVLAGHPPNPLLQCGRPVHGDLGAAVISDRRIGPIDGKLQAFGQPGQRILPVGKLGGDGAAAVVELAQLRALPQCVIGVLQGQLSPVGALAGASAGVGQSQVACQRGHRPAVGGDVMHHHHQNVFVAGDREKRCPHGDFSCQIEGVAR